MSHYNVHNLYPAEAWEVCEMFMIAAFKVMAVTLQCTQSLSSRSMGSMLLLDKDCVHCNVTAMTLNAAIINISHTSHASPG
jgi:hypothetical protein